MRTRWIAVGAVSGVCGIVAACGGSESGTAPGGVDAGPETSAQDTGARDTGNGGSILDAPFDGFIDAPEVDIKFGSCPTFAACGGDETGSWKVTGGCLGDDVLADAKKNCPDLTTSNEVIKAKGTLQADGTNSVRRTQVTLTAKAVLPKSCAPIQADCPTIGQLAQAQLGFKKVDCIEGDGGTSCACDIEHAIVENSTETYTKSGSTITTASGDTFDYCVAGSKMTYTQTTKDAPPLILEVSK